MKRINAIVIGFAIICGLATTTGCNKDGGDNNLAFSSLVDSTGKTLLSLTYDNNDKLVRMVADQTTYDLSYNDNGNLIRRVLTRAGSVDEVDSVFYDGNGRMVRFETYDGSNIKKKSTVLTFNTGNNVSSATVNYTGVLQPDQMFEFTYSGSNFSAIKEHEKRAGVFKIKRNYEFMAFDDHLNPMSNTINKYFPDQFNLLIFMFASPNNFTSMKQTDYNVENESVTGSFPITAAYTYNSNGTPSEATVTINGNTNKVAFRYTAL